MYYFALIFLLVSIHFLSGIRSGNSILTFNPDDTTKLSTLGTYELLGPGFGFIKMSDERYPPTHPKSLEVITYRPNPFFKTTQKPAKLRPLRWGKRSGKSGHSSDLKSSELFHILNFGMYY